MQKELEIELKSLITKEQYCHIKHLFFTNEIPLIQTNTYFDTKSQLLKEHKMALRVRKSNTEHLLTLKSKQDELTSFEYSVTFEQTLIQTLTNSPALAKKIPANLSELFSLVTFTTHRYTSQLPFGLLCLDMTHYENTHVDFEIEIEIFSKAHLKEAVAWLEQFHITHHQAAPKIARALAQQVVQ